MKIALGLNIDHIATLRQARRIHQPDPLEAVFIAKNAQVQQITIHLREDRRHIHDDDVRRILTHSPLPVNVECACDLSAGGVVEILCDLGVHKVTLVPEKREEITTEGGLNMHAPQVDSAIARFREAGIPVAVFIEPDRESIVRAQELGVSGVELHTGAFAHCYDMLHSCLPHSHNARESMRDFVPKSAQARADLARELKERLAREINALECAASYAHTLGLLVFAGHGLNYENIAPIVKLPHLQELNIGHSIIARALMVGLYQAIKDMQEAIANAL